jgi:hypothetical protein
MSPKRRVVRGMVVFTLLALMSWSARQALAPPHQPPSPAEKGAAADKAALPVLRTDLQMHLIPRTQQTPLSVVAPQ